MIVNDPIWFPYSILPGIAEEEWGFCLFLTVFAGKVFLFFDRQ